MTKTFYIIIPFAAQQIKEEGGFTKFYKMLMFRRSAGVYSAEEFERNKEQLWQRVEQVAMGLKNMNIRAVPLNTQEIIELFYMLYNPDISRHQRLAAIEELEIEEIQRLMTKEAPTPEEAERLYRLRRSMYM
jgi:DNA polymerase III epsilon subunit-like protein